MRRFARPMCLLLLTVSAGAQQHSLKVRLFWQHPPTKINVASSGSSMRACESCPSQPWSGTLQIDAHNSTVRTRDTTSPILILSGDSRISGDEFSSFQTRDELNIQAKDGLLLLTLTMPLEQYVAAVLQGESASFRSDEALKAMAVAARTYTVHFGSRHDLEGFNFCDTTHCQDVRLSNPSTRVHTAVAATAGEMLWYEGHPAATYYHRSCGGEIESATLLDPKLQVTYLRQHHDPYCVRTQDEWQAEISKSELARALEKQVNTVTVAARSDSGRVQKLLINGHPVAATDFRLAIGRTLGWDKVRSDLYQAQDLGDRVYFRGRGHGHGVGLCQAGAESMGEQGLDYRDILAFYYPGTMLSINAQGVDWQKLPSELLDILTTNRADAAVLLPVAERALRLASQRTGWTLSARPQLKVYPTISIYRDATGEPGWVAASTRGSTIRLQPISFLQRAGALESTLLHEFMHMTIESQARPETPLWLREGLTIYLSAPDATKAAKVDVANLEKCLHSVKTEAEMRTAYRDSAAAVADAVQQNGLAKVLSWVSSGQ